MIVSTWQHLRQRWRPLWDNPPILGLRRQYARAYRKYPNITLLLTVWLGLGLYVGVVLFTAWLASGAPSTMAEFWGSDLPLVQEFLPTMQRTLGLPSARWLIWLMVLLVAARAVQLFLPIVLDVLRATRARDPDPAETQWSMILVLVLLVLILTTLRS